MSTKIIGGSSTPMICTPLVGKSQEAIIKELEQVITKKPDIIEWRADFFANIAVTEAVLAIANQIKTLAGEIPIIFTIRSTREGGQPISLSDGDAISLNAAIAEKTDIEYIDCELGNKSEHIRSLQKTAAKHGAKIIGSYHNFDFTPDAEFLGKKFDEAASYRLDVAKVAVMPQKIEDVLTLLSSTLAAKQRLTIPLITMSMGGYGAVSRMIGGVFGSSLSFAVGAKSSAPGQVPIEDLRTVLSIIENSITG